MREYYSLIVFISIMTFLSFLEPHSLPEPPTQEELDQYAVNVKAAKVQGHVSRKPGGVHPPVPK
jgi:hypothetical protein